MNQLVLSALLAVGLFFALLLAQYAGRALGKWRLERSGEDATVGAGAVEGAAFALLGLLLAFTFSGADARLQHRRDLIIEQVNALGTAWMRLDLLPAADHPAIRSLFKRYVDDLQKAAANSGDPGAVAVIAADLQVLQNQIWRECVASVNRDGRPQVASLLLPPLNDSFDLSTSRIAASRIHVQPAVIAFLLGLSVVAGFLAGHAQASAKRPSLVYMLIFAALISATIYFIMDFEYPRRGLVTLKSADAFMNELRTSLND